VDLSARKVASYRRGIDPGGEVSAAQFAQARWLEIGCDPVALAEADYIVVAVPTPVDEAHRPDFSALVGASQSVGRHMKPGAVVIYESTVYPGATEEVCIPILEQCSGLQWQRDFHVGFSPERINPGDTEHPASIRKVVSGDDAATLERVAALYEGVVEAGVHRASSIKVAEAAKVIENTQRDLNIALMNELAIIFDRIGIDTGSAAGGRHQVELPAVPAGLVGGHCIGVDPYYLTHKAMLGYHPHVILAGRRINDGMAKFVAEKTIKKWCAPASNSRAPRQRAGADLQGKLPGPAQLQGGRPDPRTAILRPASPRPRPGGGRGEACEYGVRLEAWEELPCAEALISAVAHRELAARPLRQMLDKIVPTAASST
jgi:UDP-N-acetyl-D-galactosamine dehydrogenase